MNFLFYFSPFFFLIIFINIELFFLKKNKYQKPSLLLTGVFFFIDSMNILVNKNIYQYKKIITYTISSISFLLFYNSFIGIFVDSFNKELPFNLIVSFFLFAVMQFIIFSINGWKKYLEKFIQPFSFFLPLNIISELMFIFATTMRLFGANGSILLITNLKNYIFGESSFFLRILASSLLPLLHLFFDIALAFIQSYSLFSLVLILTSNKINKKN